MGSPILELQRRARDPEIAVSDLLRDALTIAVKLNIAEFEAWIELELDGYPEDVELPKYRILRAELRAKNPHYGWVPAIFPDGPEKLEMLSIARAIQSIAEIEVWLYSGKDTDPVLASLPKKLELKLIKGSNSPLPLALHIDKSQLRRIVDAVRNAILKWSLKLEKDGILGGDMIFSTEEKQTASSATYHIENFIGAGANVQIQRGTIESTQSITIDADFDLGKLGDELAALREEMKKQATTPEQDAEVGEIASAELAAKKGDRRSAFERLARAGKWSLEVAEKIGTSLTVAYLKATMGLD